MDVSIYQDETDPDLYLAWRDEASSDPSVLRDLTEWTGSIEVIEPATFTVVITKTSGVVLGDGTDPSNFISVWTTEELTTMAGGWWYLRPIVTKGLDKSIFTKDGEGTLMTLEVMVGPGVGL